MTAAQFGLFEHHPPPVSIDSPEYRAGYLDGFVAPRNAPEPVESRAYLAGWRDGVKGCQVPRWRL